MTIREVKNSIVILKFILYNQLDIKRHNSLYAFIMKRGLIMITKKLGNIASVQMGLVLSRKEAKMSNSSLYPYIRLTLKSLDVGGIIDFDNLEKFNARELLNDQFICQKEILL
ncbi:hypothetical protein JQ035_00995 [Clostridium botulinum]|nr:hypothetical protein [Clostridium botulinum]